MSVLIKGMDMPRSCKDCLLRSAEPNFLCSATNTNIMAHICFFNPPRPKDCPLVSVPTPHGDLIDRDELQKKFDLAQKALDQHGQEFSDSFMSTSQEVSTEWWAVEQKLDDAETVIESED